MARLRFGYFIAPFHRAGTNPTLALQRDLEFAEHLDALVRPVAHAPEALAALGRAGHDHAVPDPHPVDMRPDLLDNARRRVAENGRRHGGDVAAGAERVGDADVDRGDPDHDLVRHGRAQLHLLDDQRPPDLLEDCSPRGHTV